jgi:hypothetical protein
MQFDGVWKNCQYCHLYLNSYNAKCTVGMISELSSEMLHVSYVFTTKQVLLHFNTFSPSGISSKVGACVQIHVFLIRLCMCVQNFRDR